MHYPVAQSRWFPPGQTWVDPSEFLGDLARALSQHGQIPQERISTHPVPRQCRRISINGYRMRLARSRRIERLRFSQHMVTHPTMNGSTGDEVYSPPKNFGQSLRKILDFPPQTHTRFQRKQEINVAIRASIPTRHGAENFKARDPVAFTQFAQTFLVHDLDRHAQSLDAAQPIPASDSPSHP